MTRSESEAGFTMIELLVVLVIMPLIIGAIAAAIIISEQDSGVASSRLSDSASAQTISEYYVRDVQGAEYITTNSAASSPVNVCVDPSASSPRQLVLGLYRDPTALGAQLSVAYWVVPVSNSYELVRYSCNSLGNMTSQVVITNDITSPSQATVNISPAPFIAAAAAGWMPTTEANASISSVTISLTEPGSSYAYTLQASPRSQSGVALLSLGNASVQNGATITVDGNVDVNGTITDGGSPPGLTATGGKHQNTNVTDVVAAGLPDQVTTFPPNIVPSCSFPSGSFTLAAGTYNCQLVVGPTATVTLSPGVYQLNDGISVSGTLNYTTNPNSQGEGVLLYLPCSGPCNEGAIIAPGASVTLPPLTAAQSVTASTSATINPKTPALQDMWFWQAGGDSSEDDLIGNGQGGQTSGIFYAPSATADLSSSSGSDATGDIIAQTVITSASTAMTITGK